MQIHQLKLKQKKKKAKRVGRGGKRGTFSGRGVKGQKSRAGGRGKAKSLTGRRSPIRKLAKVKGFKSIHPRPAVVKLEQLEKNFSDGQKVTAQSLLDKKLVANIKEGVKILNDGQIAKKLEILDIKASKTAKEKIEKAGGKVKLQSSIQDSASRPKKDKVAQ